MKKLVLAALCCLFPALCVADTTGLTRLTGRDALLGWEAIGRLDMDGLGFCTGTLISSDLVLTAAHCVYDKSTKSAIKAETITFRAGLRDGEAVVERGVERIAAHPSYQVRDGVTPQNIRHDVALLKLKAPITTTDADPYILHKGPIEGRKVSIVSYGRGRSEALSRQRGCNILGRRGDLLAFDCNVTFGSSGAPVFVHTGGRGRILSIISSGSRQGKEVVAYGMSLPEMVSELKTELRRTSVRKPSGVRRITVGGGARANGAKFVRSSGS